MKDPLETLIDVLCMYEDETADSKSPKGGEDLRNEGMVIILIALVSLVMLCLGGLIMFTSLIG